ncbi:ABC transporter family substrate-binding protein [Glycomyces sp. L485]|uniref:ABC transporter family substrate-binding protein n=1 Tax=Glycomyces sp. L485 TaxID=2909235 RepID=UPI001F4AB4E9|nr:ABC transporter family substrate-binding protein [Glycomyces sp. L485]MCH7232959.1 ABC transporter family substrate-binding protein [Glycomyces sp. L485]
MRPKHRPAAVAALPAAATLVLSACGAGASAGGGGFDDCEDRPVTCNSGERADGGEITWAIDGSWAGWNLSVAADNSAYLNSALAGVRPFEGQFDQEGRWQFNDGLLSADPELVSEDPVQVAYELNPDATWGDGTRIGVDDFVYHWYARSGDESLCAGCTPATTSYGSAVASIDANGSTVTVTYDDGYSSAEWRYEQVLSHPAHIAEDAGFDWREDPEAMKASQDHFSETVPTWTAGPYRITDAELGQFVIYEPNPEWAGSAEVTLDRITLESFDSVDSIITEMRQGTVDGASPVAIGAEHISQLQSADGIDFAVAPGPGWEHIDLNTDNEFLSDPALRTAVFQAIDVENIIDRTYANVQTDAQRKRNHLFRGESEYFVDKLSATGQGIGDIELARRTLDAAGYSWDADNRLRTPDDEPVTLSYGYTESRADRAVVAQLVQANLADLGVEIELDPFSSADLGPTLFEGRFDIVAFGWSTSPTFVGGASQYWSSSSSSNFGGLDDEALDEILDRLNGTLDIDTAAEIANEAVAQVIGDAYVLPVIDTPVAVMASDELVNVRDNWASQERALYNIAEWGVRTDE